MTFEYGAAGLQGFLVRDLSGLDTNSAFEMTFSSIGYSIDGQLSWDARRCCVPKIDGFTSHPDGEPIRLNINVKGPFKHARAHTPLAIEWGNDDAGNIEVGRPIEAVTRNSFLHMMPAPPLIPPTHYPKMLSSRITQTITHDAVEIHGNPWARLYSNMTLAAGSELPFGLVLTGFIDKDGKHDSTHGDPIDAATIIEATRFTGAEDILHSASGDANSAIRLGHGPYPPPKYVWIKGPIEFDNVARDGQLIYSPAWHGLVWTLRIDSPLQAGVRIKLGDAQSYTGKKLSKSQWFENQIGSPKRRTGEPRQYFVAVAESIPKGSSPNDKKQWEEIKNPFQGLTLIYRNQEFKLGRGGAVIGSDGSIIQLD